MDIYALILIYAQWVPHCMPLLSAPLMIILVYQTPSKTGEPVVQTTKNYRH